MNEYFCLLVSTAHFKNQKIEFQGPTKRFGDIEEGITIYDPDGLELELVAHESAVNKQGRIIDA